MSSLRLILGDQLSESISSLKDCNLNTDIMATIYEMRYGVTLAPGQFNTSLNPSWDSNNLVRITEIGLYDNTNDLMAIAKLKNPTKRLGAQTFQIKIDF